MLKASVTGMVGYEKGMMKHIKRVFIFTGSFGMRTSTPGTGSERTVIRVRFVLNGKKRQLASTVFTRGQCFKTLLPFPIWYSGLSAISIALVSRERSMLT